MANTLNQYPLTKFHFSVTWGNGEMSFQEVTGLELTREIVEYRGGLDNTFVKQCIPAMKSYGELTLKRGTFSNNFDFFEWWNAASDDAADENMPARRDLTIHLKNPKGDDVMTWQIARALPTKLTSTDLNAENNEIAIETLVLKHEGITIS